MEHTGHENNLTDMNTFGLENFVYHVVNFVLESGKWNKAVV
jgi:hypothetical protein